MTSSCVLMGSVVFASLRPRGLWLTRLLCPWNFPGKNTGAGCCFLLQGSSRPRDRTFNSWVSCIGRQILYYCTTWEALTKMRTIFSWSHKGDNPEASSPGGNRRQGVHLVTCFCCSAWDCLISLTHLPPQSLCFSGSLLFPLHWAGRGLRPVEAGVCR